MAGSNTNKGPKHRVLTEDETFATFEDWQSRMKAILRKDSDYTRFLLAQGPDTSWEKVSPEHPHRGLKDDENGDPKVKKAAKLLHLNGMLDEIAQWAPHYISHEIKAESTSIESVWNIIRCYYQFQQNEVQFMSFLKLQWEGPEKERPEHLYRKLMHHIHDNTLRKDGQLTYNGKNVQKNEEITPTVERLVILRWLELMDTRLPSLVARTFSHELQTRTLKDIQPQISSSIDSFLGELKQADVQANFMQVHEGLEVLQEELEVQASRVNFKRPQSTQDSTWQKKGGFKQSQTSRSNQQKSSGSKLQCRLCRAEGRRYLGHSMANCGYIGNHEKRNMVKSYKVDASHPDEEYDPSEDVQNLNIDEA